MSPFPTANKKKHIFLFVTISPQCLFNMIFFAHIVFAPNVFSPNIFALNDFAPMYALNVREPFLI